MSRGAVPFVIKTLGMGISTSTVVLQQKGWEEQSGRRGSTKRSKEVAATNLGAAESGEE